MAELNLKVSVETVVHDMLAKMAQTISTEYGINIESVHFRWLHNSTMTGLVSSVSSVQLTSVSNKQ